MLSCFYKDNQINIGVMETSNNQHKILFLNFFIFIIIIIYTYICVDTCFIKVEYYDKNQIIDIS